MYFLCWPTKILRTIYNTIDSFVLNLLLETVGRVCHLVSIDKLFENTDKRSSMSYKLEKIKVMEWAENLSFHNREEVFFLLSVLYFLHINSFHIFNIFIGILKLIIF